MNNFILSREVDVKSQCNDHCSGKLTYRYLDQNYKKANTGLKATE
ncbi:hypothetical protein [Photobacterium phosphoreum]|nr:hypothetical protein [Photobacterium phosphoreum]